MHVQIDIQIRVHKNYYPDTNTLAWHHKTIHRYIKHCHHYTLSLNIVTIPSFCYIRLLMLHKKLYRYCCGNLNTTGYLCVFEISMRGMPNNSILTHGNNTSMQLHRGSCWAKSWWIDDQEELVVVLEIAKSVKTNRTLRLCVCYS